MKPTAGVWTNQPCARPRPKERRVLSIDAVARGGHDQPWSTIYEREVA